jgi:hypothetical protein
MLPYFTEHEYVDTEYYFVWETRQWYKPTGIFAEVRKENEKSEPATPVSLVDQKDLVEGDDAWIRAGMREPPKAYRRF